MFRLFGAPLAPLFAAAIPALGFERVPVNLLVHTVRLRNRPRRPFRKTAVSSRRSRTEMLRRSRTLLLGLVLSLVAGSLPANAARPLLDYHKLDAYFALYAPDTSVPWKPTTVRLDTYTSAPVDFAVYQVDPADVIVAGSNTRPRAVDTRRRTAIARWRYAPPGGYRFQSNDVSVPLGSREGFFVVEARRGNVGEQVWIDRTRIGLLTKETPSGFMLFGADLGSGAPLARMRVSFIVNGRFVDRFTDRNGLIFWRSAPRPIFALAQWGNSSAFISFLPQAPLPSTIVGVKTDSAVVHADDDLHVVGFARSRSGARLRASSGDAAIVLRSNAGVAAQTHVRLDGAGAFATALHVPASSSAGEYTVIATVNGASAGTSVHVDANAAGLSLSLAPQCEAACAPDRDVPVVVHASRGGVPAAGVKVAVDIVRSPHVYVGETPDQPWGIAGWFSAPVTTGSDGSATFAIPHPSDGLASTYGVRVSAGGATADTRIAVPTAPVAVRVDLAGTDIGSGTPAAFEVSAANVATGKPAAGLRVTMQLVHGASTQEQTLTLDDRGRAHGAFSAPHIGSNLVVAIADTPNGRAMDAAQVRVEPLTMLMQDAQNNENVRISLDRGRYAQGDTARVQAELGGAQGGAVMTLESATGTQVRVVSANGGHANASFRIADAPGVLAAGAAFVRDGALQWSSVPLIVDAPGRPLSAAIQLDRSAYLPGTTASATIGDVRPGQGTLVVRLTRGAPTGSAVFVDAPDLLAIGTTATQDSAAAGSSWHPWVDSTGDHAIIQSFASRSAPPADLTMTQADTASIYWKVDRGSGDSVQLPVPAIPGKYVLSLLKIDDDGRVTAASSDLVVQ
jgi:hypothetical protein